MTEPKTRHAEFLLCATRIPCAAVLAFAGALKLAAPGTMPPVDNALVRLVHHASPVLAILEFLLAALLVLPNAARQRLAALGAATLVGVGCLYLVWLRVIGLSELQCGCFGGAVRLSLANHLLLNGVLLGLLTTLLAQTKRVQTRPSSALRATL